MKKLVLLSSILFLALSLSVDATPRHGRSGKTDGGQKHDRGYRNDNPSVGAPLDGGLLLVLGAAGAAYLVSRKKEEKE